MPSSLRSGPQSSIAKPSALLQRKQKMTLSQTYYLAHVARGKLSKEAAKADHDLRLLVGHANLLDGLMLDLADAEREQESWFNQTVKGASSSTATSTDSGSSSTTTSSSNDRHIRWPETLPSVTEDYEEDSDDNSSDDEAEAPAAPARKGSRPAALTIPSVSAPAVVDEDEDEDEDMAEDPEEHAENLRLHRTPSHSSPPELMEGCESESDSESDDMPPSPPAPKMQRSDAFAKPQPDAAATTQDAFYEEGFYLPQRQPVAVY